MTRDFTTAMAASLLAIIVWIGDFADSILEAGRIYCGLVTCELSEDESEELSRW